jgi:hypothetical protein
MERVIVDTKSKKEVERLIEILSEADERDAEKFLDEFSKGAGPGWHRFLKGAYNQPITWWIGIIQLQMQLGMWGPKRKSQSQLVANQLGQALRVIKENAGQETLLKALKYNLKYKKADILGRFSGGVFTNYASKGGRVGGQKVNANVGRAINLSNFVLASYGACIKAVGTGHKKSEHIIQSVLTGHPNGPVPYPNSYVKLSKEERELLIKAEQGLNEMSRLSDLSSSPTPISDFCERPENINIKGLCK